VKTTLVRAAEQDAAAIAYVVGRSSRAWRPPLRERKRNIVTSNYLEAGVSDAVNLADKPVVNDDDTPGSAHNRPQNVANVISFTHCPICTRNSGTLALRQCCVFFMDVFFLPESLPSRVQTSNA
jgi:hypothetical protein